MTKVSKNPWVLQSERPHNDSYSFLTIMHKIKGAAPNEIVKKHEVKMDGNRSLSEDLSNKIYESFSLCKELLEKAHDTMITYGENSSTEEKNIVKAFFGTDLLGDEYHTVRSDLLYIIDTINHGLQDDVTIKVDDYINLGGYVTSIEIPNDILPEYVLKRTSVLLDGDTEHGHRLGIDRDTTFVNGNIHLSNCNVFKRSTRSLAMLILHEASHRYARTDDVWYTSTTIDGVFKYFPPEVAIRNADTIAIFCLYLTFPDYMEKFPCKMMDKEPVKLDVDTAEIDKILPELQQLDLKNGDRSGD